MLILCLLILMFCRFDIANIGWVTLHSNFFHLFSTVLLRQYPLRCDNFPYTPQNLSQMLFFKGRNDALRRIDEIHLRSIPFFQHKRFISAKKVTECLEVSEFLFTFGANYDDLLTL